MKPLLIFSFLFLLVLTPFIQAAQQIDLVEGYEITSNTPLAIKYNEDFEFAFHVYNETRGTFVDNSSTDCFFEIHKQDGTDLIEVYDFNYNQDRSESIWTTIVTKGNFTVVGFYIYHFQCNSTIQGGLLVESFEITYDGKTSQVFSSNLVILIISFLILFFGIYSKERLIKMFSSIMLIISGILILYPGYDFISGRELMGLMLGSISIGFGFYYLIEDSFSKSKQEETFDQEEEFAS